MKQAIERHKDCVKNWRMSLEKEIEAHRQWNIRLVEQAKQVNFYQSQIEEAERRGLDAFDDERLLVRRKKK